MIKGRYAFFEERSFNYERYGRNIWGKVKSKGKCAAFREEGEGKWVEKTVHLSIMAMATWEWADTSEGGEVRGALSLDVACNECKIKYALKFNLSDFEEAGFWVH